MGFFSKLFPVSVPLSRPDVPEGVTRICVSGFGISHHTGRARAIATAVAELDPDQYETWYYFDSRGFRPEFLDSIKLEMTKSNTLSDEAKKIRTDHTSSPCCWLETTGSSTKKYQPIGGRDKLCEWVQTTLEDKDAKNAALFALCQEAPPRSWKEIKFDATTPGTTKLN